MTTTTESLKAAQERVETSFRQSKELLTLTEVSKAYPMLEIKAKGVYDDGEFFWSTLWMSFDGVDFFDVVEVKERFAENGMSVSNKLLESIEDAEDAMEGLVVLSEKDFFTVKNGAMLIQFDFAGNAKGSAKFATFMKAFQD